MNVDDRLHHAADALRVEVASHVEVGVPGIHPRRSIGRRPVLVGLAAALVIALSAVVLFRTTADAPNRPASVTASGRIRPGDTHVRLGWVPEGFVIRLATDGGSSQGSGSVWDHEQDFIRYTPARDRAAAVLTVRTGYTQPDQDLRTAAANLTQSVGYPVETIRVRDRDAVRIGPTIAWHETPDTIAAVSGPLDPGELIAFVDALRARTTGKGFDPGPLPAGYEALPERPGFVEVEADSMVSYSPQRGERGSLVSPFSEGTLELFVSTDTSLPLTTALADPDARLVTVNGAQGVLEGDRNAGRKITWDPHPGLRIQLSSTLPVSQLLRAARSTTSMTDRAWQRYGDPHAVAYPDAKPSRGTATSTTGR